MYIRKENHQENNITDAPTVQNMTLVSIYFTGPIVPITSTDHVQRINALIINGPLVPMTNNDKMACTHQYKIKLVPTSFTGPLVPMT